MEIESSNQDNNYWPKVTNITLKRATGCTPEVVGDVQVDAFQFKREGNGDFSNIIIDGYKNYTEGSIVYPANVVKIQDAITNTHQVNGSKIKLTNITFTNTDNQIGAPLNATYSISFPTGQYTTGTTATGALLTTGAWATVGSVNLIQ